MKVSDLPCNSSSNVGDCRGVVGLCGASGGSWQWGKDENLNVF